MDKMKHYLCDPAKARLCPKRRCAHNPNALPRACYITLDPKNAVTDRDGMPVEIDPYGSPQSEVEVWLPKDGYDARLCPRCGHETRVQTVQRHKNRYWIRYRMCTKCNARYNTVELDYLAAQPPTPRVQRIIRTSRGPDGGPGSIDRIKGEQQ